MDCLYSEILRAVRGRVTFSGRRARFRGDVSLDTRTLKPGDLFIPLKGKNFDGHDFIPQAFEKGARLALVGRGYARRFTRWSQHIVMVDNTLQALGRLAAFHRRRYRIPVVAVTGSCGKTTTKDLIAHLCALRYRVLKNEGTENNFIGVPKTLLRIRDENLVVVELGTNHAGEIRYLARIVNPTHAVITLIGNAHLTGFRSVQGVKREKLSLIEALEDGATVVYNGEDRNIRHVLMRRFRCVRAGFSPLCDHYATRIEYFEQGTAFSYRGKQGFTLPLLGRHNVLNALLAIAVAQELSIDVKRMGPSLKSFKPEKGRVRYQEIQGIHWIDDSYNSNPTSLQAAIELFDLYPPKGRKVLVLGDMLELGSRSRFFHSEAGVSIAHHNFTRVITVGQRSRETARSAVRHGYEAGCVSSFEDIARAIAFLKDELREGDTVLLKGSRGMRMERILHSFQGSLVSP